MVRQVSHTTVVDGSLRSSARDKSIKPPNASEGAGPGGETKLAVMAVMMRSSQCMDR